MKLKELIKLLEKPIKFKNPMVGAGRGFEALYLHMKEEKSRWKPSDCRKGIEGCFCVTGYRKEEQCPDCRDNDNSDRFSYCTCPPKDSDFQD